MTRAGWPAATSCGDDGADQREPVAAAAEQGGGDQRQGEHQDADPGQGVLAEQDRRRRSPSRRRRGTPVRGRSDRRVPHARVPSGTGTAGDDAVRGSSWSTGRSSPPRRSAAAGARAPGGRGCARRRAARSRGPAIAAIALAARTRCRVARGEAPERELLRAPGGRGQRDDVALDGLGDVDLAARCRMSLRTSAASVTGSRSSSGLLPVCEFEHRDLGGLDRVAHRDPGHEAVALGLGQRVGALHLDGVLGRDHHERRRRAGTSCCRP